MNNSNSIFSTVMRRRGSLAAGLLLLLAPSLAVGAPAPWIQAISAGGGGNNISNAVKVAPDNSRYVTGQFSSTAVFAGTTLTSTGGLDIFIAKYGPSGNLLWIVKAGGVSDDIGYSLDLDANGNVLVTGQFITSATFGTTSGAAKAVTALGRAIFLAKYSPSGALLWVQTGVVTVDGWYNWGFGVAVDATTGTAYIAAISQGDTTFSSTNGTLHTVAGVETWHMVLAKYDTNGNFLWAQTNQASPNSIPNAVAVDASGNAYVAGWLENTTSFSSADGHSITVIGFSPGQANTDFPDDAFLAKYDGNGNLKWVNHIGGYKAIASRVAVSPGGEISMAGFVGNINFGTAAEAQTVATSQPPGANINLGGGTFTNPYNPDAFIATYNSAGVLQRAIRRGGAAPDGASGIAYDAQGRLYVDGLSEGANGQTNLFVLGYSGGNLLWQETAVLASTWLGEPTIAPALAVNNVNDVVVSGGFKSAASFGTINLSGVGVSDIFLSELNPAYITGDSADLSLRVIASPTPVVQGQLLTYTFPVWNLGPAAAVNEVLTTQVPAGTTFDYVRVSGTPGLASCTHPPYGGTGPVVCRENASMASNTTWTVRLTVKVTAPSGTSITESATASEDTPDPNLANNTASVSATVQ